MSRALVKNTKHAHQSKKNDDKDARVGGGRGVAFLPPRSGRDRASLQNLLHRHRLLVIVLEAHFLWEFYAIVSLSRLQIPKFTLPVSVFFNNHRETLQNPVSDRKRGNGRFKQAATGVGGHLLATPTFTLNMLETCSTQFDRTTGRIWGLLRSHLVCSVACHPRMSQRT